MFKEVNNINENIVNTKETLYYRDLNFYIVPIDKKDEFEKSNPNDIYFTTYELFYLFSIKIRKEDLDSILMVKRVMHPSDFLPKEQIEFFRNKPL